jgi:AcrR family transcriptional regulator
MHSVEKPRSERALQIVAAARRVLEADGPEAVSMRRIADEVGIRAPSLYKHFPDKRALEAAIISAAFEEQAVAFTAAVRESNDPLADLSMAYRRFAVEHPHLYRLMTDRELQRDLLAPGVEDRAGRPVVDAVGGDLDRARAAWAFAHGMALLELTNRFPPDADIDAAWREGIDAFRPARTPTRRSNRS